MQVALLADIHSNLHALEAVLEAVDAQGVDRIYCLGDIVGYNAYPRECLQLVEKRADLVLMGNHDWAVVNGATPGFNPLARAGVDYSRAALDPQDVARLASLKPQAHETHDGKEIDLYHASPLDPLWGYVFPQDAPQLLKHLEAVLPLTTPKIVALGHTHHPMIVSSPSPVRGMIESLANALTNPETLSGRSPLILLNPGSVGQPRDGDPRASFAIVDFEHIDVRFHRVEYDMQAAAAAVRAAGLPGLLADRLLVGR